MQLRHEACRKPCRREARARPAGRRRARVVSGRRLRRAVHAWLRSGLGRGHFHRRDQRGDHRRQSEGAARRAAEGILGAGVLAGAVAAARQGRAVAHRLQRGERRAASPPSACPASSRRACRRRRCGRAERRRRSATTTPRRCAQTLERLVDFDLINAKQVRLSVGAVNVRTGNFAYFDNALPENRPRAHHGVRRAAARISAGRDRRRALLGRRPRLEHAARLCAGAARRTRTC